MLQETAVVESATLLVVSRINTEWRLKLSLAYVSYDQLAQQIVTNLNIIDGILSFAAINLALKCPRIADPRVQQISVLAWAGSIYLIYSFLLNIFRWKNGGYPFYLPPF